MAPLMLLGTIYDESGRPNDALDIARRLLPSHPGHAAGLATRAWLVLHRDLPEVLRTRPVAPQPRRRPEVRRGRLVDMTMIDQRPAEVWALT
jgi:hypothetical protein